ncbi:MAG: hypothetical protein WC328_16265 [Kiritimatiellia bacterium]|jgi:hypothetical protein|nr:hypothetical protein [Kiritimatiellia bacterium]NLC82711.1 hypothetical protein [Lentisphaerota bacterium]
MNTLTLHALDSTLSDRLKTRAKREKKSLNQTAKELLAFSLGITAAKPKSRHDEFAPLCGVWTEKDAKRFEADVACFSEIEGALWK